MAIGKNRDSRGSVGKNKATDKNKAAEKSGSTAEKGNAAVPTVDLPQSVSVIIPCFNEEETIENCVNAIPELPWECEIIVVDDGSKDRTAEVARKIKRSNLKVVSYKPNGGKGHAFRTGFEAATGDVVVIQDADMNPEQDLVEVLKPLFEGKADFVNGTRFVYPMEKGAMKALHVPGNMAFASLVSLMCGAKLSDSLCGYKAFRRKMLLGQLHENSWPDFEMLIKAGRNKMRIVEVPIHYNKRKKGESKMRTFKHGWNMLAMLVKAAFEK